MTIRSTLFPTLRGTLQASLGAAGGAGYPLENRVLDFNANVTSFTISDKSGFANDATVTASANTGTQNWNKYRDFSGGTPTTGVGFTGRSFNGDFDIEMFLVPDVTGSSMELIADSLGGSGAGNSRIFLNGTRTGFTFSDTDGVNAAVSLLSTFPSYGWARFTRAGDQVSVYVDNVLQGTETLSTATMYFDSIGKHRLGASGTIAYQGIIGGVYISETGSDVLSYSGVGDDPWKDLVSTLDGIEEGSLSDSFVGESSGSVTLDSYGNQIYSPRYSKEQFNPAAGDSWTVADSASLSSIKTVSCWYIWDGVTTPETIRDLGIATLVNTAGTFSTTGITAPTLYVNGVAGNTLTVGANHVAITTDTAIDSTGINTTVPSGTDLDYSEALSAEDVLKAYNGTKSKYDRGEIDLFLAAGQSNAVGSSGSPSTITPNASKAFLYGKQGNIGNIVDPVYMGLRTGSGSMWPSFANKYIELTGRKVAVAGFAKGGTAQVAAADYGVGNWDAAGFMYGLSVDYFNDAIDRFEKLGYTVNVRGILWSQGEQDAEIIRTGGITAQNYTDALTAMMVRFRAEYGTGFEMHMVRAGVRTNVADTGGQAIRDAQDAYVAGDANSYMATTDTVNFPAWGWMADTVHYNQTGQDYCGEKVAESAAALI